MAVKDIDHGWNRIKGELQKMDKAYVKVGIQSYAGSVEGVHIAQYAAWNEFGTSDGHVPERSFLRSSFDESRGKYFTIIQNQIEDIWQGKSTALRSLSLVGMKAQSDIQRKITNLKEPPNAASTIRMKGSSNPLIDDGTMRRSIQYDVVGAGGAQPRAQFLFDDAGA